MVRFEEDGCLVCPGAGDVARGIPATTDDEEGQAEGFGEGDTGAVRAHVQVEAAQAVAAKTVGSALEDDCAGAVGVDAGADYVVVELNVGFVIDAVVERDVDGVVCAGVEGVCRACIVEGSSSGKKLSLSYL